MRIILVSFIILLTACGSPNIKDLRKEVEQNYDTAGKRLGDHKTATHYQEFDDAWVGGEKVDLKEKTPPELDRSIPFSTSVPMGLRDIASALTDALNIPVTLEPDVFIFDSGQQSSESTTTATDSTGTLLGLPSTPSVTNISASNIDTSQKQITLQFNGKVTRLLDRIVSAYGLNWEYRDKRIVISRLVTEVFRVAVLHSETNFDATVGGNAANETTGLDGLGGNSNNTGSVNQTMTLQEDGSIFRDIAATVTNMLSPSGSLNASETTGTIAVTDTPSTIYNIRKYIRKENSHVTKQVHFKVTILSIEREVGADYGLNLDFNLIASSLGLSFATPALDVVTGAGSLAAQVLPGSGSSFADTEALVQALNTLENVSVLDEINTSALNYKNVPIQVTTSQGFIASEDATVPEGGGTVINSSEVGTITTGLLMFAKPVILESFENQMLLRITLDISQFLGFTTAITGSGDTASTRMLPNIDQRASIFERRVRSGETIVLSGFENLTTTTDESGLLSPNYWWLGGNSSGDQENSRILILVTPTIISRI